MSGGDTTQFLFAPNLTPGNRKVVLALAGLFCASCLLCTVLLILLDIYQSSMKSLLALFGSPVVIAAALLPNILLAFLIPLLQRHQRTHRYVLIGAFLAGAVIAIPPAGTINTILFLPFTALHLRLIGYGTVPGIVEEGVKGLLLLFIYFLYRDEFHDAVDGVVLGALVGLGFAMTEDIEYFPSFFSIILF